MILRGAELVAAVDDRDGAWRSGSGTVASSMAESPPPTTAMCLSLKKKPSQVAHQETPWPGQALLAREAESR